MFISLIAIVISLKMLYSLSAITDTCQSIGNLFSPIMRGLPHYCNHMDNKTEEDSTYSNTYSNKATLIKSL